MENLRNESVEPGRGRGFTKTPISVSRDSSLSLGARVLYSILQSYCILESDKAWPSVEKLGQHLGVGKRQVQILTKELAEAGLITVQYQIGPKGCNVYTLSTPPIYISGGANPITPPAKFKSGGGDLNHPRIRFKNQNHDDEDESDLSTLSEESAQADIEQLTDISGYVALLEGPGLFDNVTAGILARKALRYKRSVTQLADLIDYSTGHGINNPAGWLRRVIENNQYPDTKPQRPAQQINKNVDKFARFAPGQVDHWRACEYQRRGETCQCEKL